MPLLTEVVRFLAESPARAATATGANILFLSYLVDSLGHPFRSQLLHWAICPPVYLDLLGRRTHYS